MNLPTMFRKMGDLLGFPRHGNPREQISEDEVVFAEPFEFMLLVNFKNDKRAPKYKIAHFANEQGVQSCTFVMDADSKPELFVKLDLIDMKIDFTRQHLKYNIFGEMPIGMLFLKERER